MVIEKYKDSWNVYNLWAIAIPLNLLNCLPGILKFALDMNNIHSRLVFCAQIN
jgi:hypothetical protein